MEYQYPIILHPTSAASVVKPFVHHKGHSIKHGPSEIVVFSRFLRFGLNQLHEDLCVNLGGNNYYPDFAYVNEKKNIYVDIEIDEPYSASGHPTHYKQASGIAKDSARNRRFQDAGWYIVRFTEEQAFCHTREAVKVILDVLKSAGAIDDIPSQFEHLPSLPTTAQWTENESNDMHRRGFRKSYLHFDPGKMRLRDNLYCLRLIIPILFQSTLNKKVRKRLTEELKAYLKPRKQSHRAR